MATLIKKAELYSDTDMKSRIRMAVVEVAVVILSASDPPAGSEAVWAWRRQLARRAVLDTSTVVEFFHTAVVVNEAIADAYTAGTQASVTDTMIRQRIQAVWDRIAEAPLVEA